MRRFLGPLRLGLGLILLAGLGSLTATPGTVASSISAAPAVDSRPNIVLISTDDQNVQDMAWMPKTRALLAAEGVTFEGLSPHPLCCPARAELLTGQYAHNNGVYSNAGAYGGYQALSDPDNTIAAWLHAAGYRTGFTGKFLNGYSWEEHGRPAGWDFWDPTLLGTYAYTGYTSANDGDLRVAPPGEYITDYVSSVTATRIAAWSDESQPFFFWASYVAPHTACDETKESCHKPPIPAPAYSSAYPDVINPAKSKPSFNERDVTDKPKQVRLAKKRPKNLQRLFKQRIRSLASVDDAVAQTVQALVEAGQLDNTVVIFTSDNGYLLGEHRLRGKKRPYEEAIRVPLIVRGPGFGRGVAGARTGSIVDIAPTLVSIAEATPGRILDGASLTDLQWPGLGDASETRLIQNALEVGGSNHQLWDWRGVRDDRYTWIRWSSGEIELYDRRRDPYELRNVARDPRYRAIRRALGKRFGVLRSCAGTLECYREFGPLPQPIRR